MTVQIAVRLPEALVQQIDELAGTTRSEAVRRALEAYVYRLQCERDAQIYARRPLTPSELAMADDPNGWEATPSW